MQTAEPPAVGVAPLQVTEDGSGKSRGSVLHVKNDSSVQCVPVQRVGLAYKCTPPLDVHQRLETGLQELNKEQDVPWFAFTDKCGLC